MVSEFYPIYTRKEWVLSKSREFFNEETHRQGTNRIVTVVQDTGYVIPLPKMPRDGRIVYWCSSFWAVWDQKVDEVFLGTGEMVYSSWERRNVDARWEYNTGVYAISDGFDTLEEAVQFYNAHKTQ